MKTITAAFRMGRPLCAGLGIALGLVACGGGGSSSSGGTANRVAITSAPQSKTAQVGEALTLTVQASGSAPLTYQWLRNGTAVNGATGSSFSIDQVSGLNNQDQFTVRVNSADGSALSSPATLTVPPTQGLDLLAGCPTQFAPGLSAEAKIAAAQACEGSTDGDGFSARFKQPNALAADAAGNLYIGDNGNSTVRKLATTGAVSTVAGLAGSSGEADGSGANARFRDIRGIAADTAGNVYVAASRIHKISPAGAVTSMPTPINPLVPNSSFPASSIAADGDGTLYVTVESVYNSNVPYFYRIAADGTASTPTMGQITLPAGFVGRVLFQDVMAVANSPAGKPFALVRTVTGTGSICRAAGCSCFFDCATFVSAATVDANNVVNAVGMAGPFDWVLNLGFAMDDQNNAYLAGEHAIYKIAPNGSATALAGTTPNASAGTRLGATSPSLYGSQVFAVRKAGGASKLVIADQNALVTVPLP